MAKLLPPRLGIKVAVAMLSVLGVGLSAPAQTAAVGGNWVQQSPATVPPARYGTSTVSQTASGNILLFGGFTASSANLNDTWTFDGTVWTQQSPGDRPSGRSQVAMAYNSAKGTVVLFGGSDNNQAYADTWIYNGTTWTRQTPANSPFARYGATMAYNPADGTVVLFGGIDGHGNLYDDTWTYDGVNWTERSPATRPPGRFSAAMTYNAATGNIVLFSGVTAAGNQADTWTWNGANWSQQTPATSPSPRFGHSMTYNAATGSVLLFGGYVSSAYAVNDTWSYNGVTWRQQSTPSSPPSRDYSQIAYNALTGAAVLFGGYDNSGNVLGDTWTYAAGSFLAPTTNVGTAAATQTPVYFNITSGGLLGTTQVLTQGTPNLDFTLGTGSTCTAGVMAGNTCKVNVVFKPTRPGVRLGAVNLTNAAGQVIATAMISGTGVGPQATLSPGFISTIAGNGNSGYDGTQDSGTVPATSASLTYPNTARVDAAGNVYIVDLYAHRIRKVSATTGFISLVAGSGPGYNAAQDTGTTPATAAQLAYPSGVAIDGAGNVFIADRNNSRVRKVAASTGFISTVAGNGTLGYTASEDMGTTPATATALRYPNSVAVDGAGNLYILDEQNNRVRKVAAATGFISTVAGNGGSSYDPAQDTGTTPATAAALVGASGVTLDASGNLYIADINGYRVRKVTAATGFISTVAGNGNSGYDATQDTGSTAATAAQVSPVDVAVDAAGNLYIADVGSSNIRKVNAATGFISSVAGTGARAYNAAQDTGTTPATASALNFPTGVAVDTLGNLFITDQMNLRIRKVTANSTVVFPTTTAVGTTDTADGPVTRLLNNIGNAPLVLTPPASGQNPSISAGFQLSNSSNCPLVYSASAAQSLAAGASCNEIVSFAPVSGGTSNGSLVFTDNSLNVAGATQSLPLTGTAPDVTNTAVAAVPSTITLGNNTQITVTVTDTTTTSTTPAGTVTINDTVGTQSFNLATDAPLAGGKYVLAYSPSMPGAHTITAAYIPASTALSASSGASTLTVQAPPTVTGLSPASGSSAGGTVVTISGTGFTSASTVKFGTAAANILAYISPTRIGVSSPAGTGGSTVDVTVTTGSLTSATNTADQFTYTLPPTIAEAFNPSTVAPAVSSAVTFTLGNPTTHNVTLTGVSFTDTLPSGLVVATPSGASTTCTGGSVAAAASSSSILLAGASIASGGNCTVTVNVVSATIGTYANTTGRVESDNSVDGLTATATLTVSVTPTRLVYTATPPTPINSGGNAGTVSVALQDAAGNVNTADSSSTITLTVTGPASYAQTYTATAVNGVATYNLSTAALTAAGTYTYTAAKAGVTSAVATETVNAVVPGAPTIGTAIAGNAQATVSFTAPASNGGSAITGYTVTSSPGNLTTNGTASPITVTGLTNGTAYTFTVKATNVAGTGAASASSNSVTPIAPQSITFANPGPQSFGTSPALTATATSGLAVTFTSATLSVCTVTTAGTLTFVTTGNCTINADQAGNAAYSAAPTVSQTFAINAVVPGAPAVGMATAGNAQATVSFTVPALNGGGNITGYTVTSVPGNIMATGTASPITVTGLTNGTAYTFTVKATNAAGTGAASASSNSVTPTATQTITFANPGPQSFGTSPALTATATSGLAVTFSSTTAGVCTITTAGVLTFNATGSCTIKADQAGNAAYSAAATVSQTFAVNAVAPDAPGIGTATAGNAQAAVSFTAPASNGGAAVTGYTVTSAPGNLTATGTGSPVVIAGLTNGTSYTFTVTAVNSAGSSAPSAASNPVTPTASQTIAFTQPGAQSFGATPTLTATATSGLPVSFTSASTGVCTITSGGTLTFSTTGTCSISADQAGNAAYTAAATVTRSFAVNAVAPGAAVIGSATAGDAQATVSFTAPTFNGGAAITSYAVTSSPGNIIVSGAASPITVTGLTNGTTYTFTAQAINSAGAGAASAPSNSVTPTTTSAIAFAVPEHRFGDAPFAVGASSVSSGAFTYTVVTGPATVSGDTVTLTGVGSVTLRAAQAADASHNANTQTTSFNVLQTASTTVTIAPISGATYGASSSTTVAVQTVGNIAATGAVSYSFDNGATTQALLSGGSAALTVPGTLAGGSHTLLVTYPGDANYTGGSAQQTFTVGQASTAPAVTFTPIPTHTYGDVPFTVSASSASTGTITYSVVSGPATVNGNTLTLTGAGTVVLQASQAADANYKASSGTTLFAVNMAAAPGITFAAIPTHTYGDAPFTISASSASTGAITYTVTSGPATISGNTVTLTGAGTVVLQASQAADTNYMAGSGTTSFLVRMAANASLTFAPISAHVYGDAPFAVSASSQSTGAIRYSVSSGPATINANTVMLTGAGTVVLQASQAADANYSATSATTSFAVSPAITVVAFPQATAIVYGMALGGAQLNASATAAGLGKVPGIFTYSPAAGTVPNAGIVTLTAQFTPSNPSDFTTPPAASTPLTVLQASTATVVTTSASPVLERVPVTLTASVRTTNGGTVPAGSVTFSDGATLLGTATLNPSGAATYTVTGGFTGAYSHTITAAYVGNNNQAASSGSVVQAVGSASTLALTSGGQSSFSATVQPGFATLTTVTATAGATFSGTVNFSCSGLPANVSCEFTPPSLAFAQGSTPMSTTVLIRSASMQTAALKSPIADPTACSRMLFACALPGLLLAGLGMRSRRTAAAQRLLVALFCLAGLTAVAGLTGCGSGTSPLFKTSNAVAGTYTFNVVASSGTTTATLPVTLTIQ